MCHSKIHYKFQLLTLFIAQGLLQHGQNDRIVKDKVSEVAVRCGSQSRVFNQRLLIQQTAGGGRATWGWECPQHLHYT